MTVVAKAGLLPTDSDEALFNLTVQAAPPPAPQTVTEVSGVVHDVSSGQPIPGAQVGMRDGDGTRFDTQANGQGVFRFTPTAAQPITPGQIRIQAGKDGYEASAELTRNGTAGGSVTGLRIALTSTASSAPPSTEAPSETPSEPSSDASEENDGAPTTEGKDEDSGSMMSWLLIGMGGLLVALGIGAIVLLLMRRGDDGEEEDGEEGPDPARPGPRGPLPRPGASGVYRGGPDPTMVARPAMGADRTMVTRPALADAPTALHRPAVDDEFPDPYNPPRAPQAPYGAPSGYPGPQPPGYGAGPQPTYGGAYGSPAGPPVDPYARGSEYGGPSPAGYGAGPAPGGGYGGYDGGYNQDHTAGYGGPAGYGDSGDYGAPGSGGSGGYGDSGRYDAGGYEQDSGYGGPGRHDQGGAPGGYGSAPASGGGYGGYEQGGAPGGYEQGDGAPSYGGPARHEQGGYPAGPGPQEGYDGYYDDGSRQGPPPQGRGQRRSLDWLDD